MPLNKTQQKALNIMLSGQNIFLSGKAGTGKSFVLQKFIEQCSDRNPQHSEWQQDNTNQHRITERVKSNHPFYHQQKGERQCTQTTQSSIFYSKPETALAHGNLKQLSSKMLICTSGAKSKTKQKNSTTNTYTTISITTKSSKELWMNYLINGTISTRP